MKTPFFLSLIVFIASCGAAHKNLNHDKSKDQALESLLTPEFEKFDTAIFKIVNNRPHHKEDAINKDTMLAVKNDTEIYRPCVGCQTLSIYDTNHKLLKEYQYNTEYKEFITPVLFIYKGFYTNGNIQIKVIRSWLGFKIGNEYRFNEKGDLMKVLNWDNGYDFTIEDVLSFCEKNKIKLETSPGTWRTTISKSLFGRKPQWYIEFADPHGGLGFFLLDGKTGKVKSSGKKPMPVEG